MRRHAKVGNIRMVDLGSDRGRNHTKNTFARMPAGESTKRQSAGSGTSHTVSTDYNRRK